jgi:cytochrome c oxidase assembly protein subunit 15
MQGLVQRQRTTVYKPFLAAFCAFALIWTIFLLYAGGFTTSIRAGMAFLDWPLSNGSVNPDGWLTEIDKRAEHSHRLLGAILGFLTLTMGVWIFFREERKWVRTLALFAVFLVVFQGILGGMRVKFDWLNTGADHNIAAQTFAVFHGCVAQIYLCVIVSLAVATSRSWLRPNPTAELPLSTRARRAGLWACGAIFIQLVLGAVMRHSHAGLAIPTFPLTPEGGLFPANWSFPVGIHFAHRYWAVAVLIVLGWFITRLWLGRSIERLFGPGALVVALLVIAQIYLGALVIWTARNPHAATVHMLNGAFLLASCWGLTFLSFRQSIENNSASHRTTPAHSTSRMERHVRV